MGRNMCCGIATKIKVSTKTNLSEKKEEVLKRIGSVFDLKYYDIVDSNSGNYMCLYLKEDLFNQEFKDLLKELIEISPFRFTLYDCIEFATEKKAFDGKAVKEQLIDYFNNDFALSLRKEYDKNFNRNLMKWETDKNNYRYYIDDFQYFNEDIGLDWENYFFCTDMCDYTLFDDSINSDDRINIGFNFIPLYFDIDKTDSEDISFTLRLLNHFLRASLKSNLKNTLIFGLTD